MKLDEEEQVIYEEDMRYETPQQFRVIDYKSKTF